jgi:hypothetical protein
MASVRIKMLFDAQFPGFTVREQHYQKVQMLSLSGFTNHLLSQLRLEVPKQYGETEETCSISALFEMLELRKAELQIQVWVHAASHIHS